MNFCLDRLLGLYYMHFLIFFSGQSSSTTGTLCGRFLGNYSNSVSNTIFSECRWLLELPISSNPRLSLLALRRGETNRSGVTHNITTPCSGYLNIQLRHRSLQIHLGSPVPELLTAPVYHFSLFLHIPPRRPLASS